MEGLKKEDKINPNHEHFRKISSYKTMESYRSLWNNKFNYLKEHWKLKDCEKIESHHIQAYIDYKVDYYPSKQYLQKIISAIGALEIALNLYSKNNYEFPRYYDFSIRKYFLEEAVDLKMVANNYRNRAYEDPYEIISELSYEHVIAALIELESGARLEACTYIKKEQLLWYDWDSISQTNKAIIFTKQKGGKEGNVYVNLSTYNILKNYIEKNGVFKINRQKYFSEIRDTCLKLNIPPEGTHGFRWNFAQNRMLEYADAGYSYEQSLQEVSFEMFHNRASITTHYLG